MKILVTGGNGFLGSHVCDAIRAVNHEALPISSRDYDLRFFESCAGAMYDLQPDVVVHLAARVGGIEANQKHPGLFFYENAQMGINMIEAARLHGLEKLVIIGTSCSYPADTPLPQDERDLWGGYPPLETAPYGMAKKMLIVMGQAYQEEYGLNVLHLIPTNLYGPRDNFNPKSSHVVPAIIHKVEEALSSGADTIRLWGSPNTTRDLLYVEDAAQAITIAATDCDYPDPINLGNGAETRIGILAQYIADLYGWRGQFIFDLSGPIGQHRRQLSTKRAHFILGWSAETSLADGLKKTVEWKRSH